MKETVLPVSDAVCVFIVLGLQNIVANNNETLLTLNRNNCSYKNVDSGSVMS